MSFNTQCCKTTIVSVHLDLTKHKNNTWAGKLQQSTITNSHTL